jgi:hypothetical protein
MSGVMMQLVRVQVRVAGSGGARNVFFAARQRWGGVELAAAMTNTEWGGGILRASGDPCLAIVWS